MKHQPAPTLHSTLVSERTEGRIGSHRAVFLHGLFGRGRNFTTVAQGLLPEIESLLVDLPNHGASGWTEHFDYAQLADLVAEYLRTQGCAGGENGPIDLIGHSMGGKVAMVLALRHPELVRRLVVVDISPVAGAASRSEFPHLLASLRSLDLRTLVRRVDAHDALRTAIPNDTVRGFLLQNLKREGDRFAWEPNLEMLNEEIDAVMGVPDLNGYRFPGPVLWIRGDRSGYVTDADTPAMLALFPRARRVTIRGAGHWVHSEKSEEFVSVVRHFLLSDAREGGDEGTPQS